MIRTILLTILAVCASTATAWGDLLGGTYTHVAIPANGWPGLPVYVSLPNASSGTASTQGVPAAADTNGNGVLNSALAEIFTPSTTFTLGSIAIVASGGAFQHIGILSLEFHVDKLSRPLL